MYAIVKTGGKQYKVAEGDLVKVEKIEGEPGSAVALTPVLLVDGANIKSNADQLSGVSVDAEIVEHTKGPKIRIMRYKNKTGYKKRQGHRQKLTVLKVTGIK
ncbi:50S ribosomal protein L21 [Corynebacterium occultum]|uniref:Large ribosomal subunit protein bL21 n=1 Tax=Corynebacterium occultum TaxID=2675219 RepID=A0A6B8WDG3_9CORY|nr:50S ribosomal protein L21 [Corynebacterium occultum]QGU08040.1 50S ribosomal protein L21 [Corynebacterium occultum]